MDRWLNVSPALAYINSLRTWVVVNCHSEPISWTDDALEVAWFSEWVSRKRKNDQPDQVAVFRRRRVTLRAR